MTRRPRAAAAAGRQHNAAVHAPLLDGRPCKGLFENKKKREKELQKYISRRRCQQWQDGTRNISSFSCLLSVACACRPAPDQAAGGLARASCAHGRTCRETTSTSHFLKDWAGGPAPSVGRSTGERKSSAGSRQQAGADQQRGTEWRLEACGWVYHTAGQPAPAGCASPPSTAEQALSCHCQSGAIPLQWHGRQQW